MVEAAPARKVQIAEGQQPGSAQATTSADDKRKLREGHADFLQRQQLKKQEVVMKFKRSNDAVLKVFTPNNLHGNGCISCSADHMVRSKCSPLFITVQIISNPTLI